MNWFNSKNTKQFFLVLTESEDISEERMQEFLQEASFSKFLEHPNILPTIGIVWVKGDRPKVVLPYMALGDLCSLIRKTDVVIIHGTSI